MEAETIIYYHPVTDKESVKCAAKRHWWQNVTLKSQILPADDDQRPFTLVDCPVPSFYYKSKTWKPKELSECMESVLHAVPGMADVYLHPQIMTMMSEIYADRWETCGETEEMLLTNILSLYGASCLRKQGQVTVFLGVPEETERQMEMTWRLLEPYLDRINSLLFYYKEIEETDIWEELSEHLEMYYYEYGLVPQLTPYQMKAPKKEKVRVNLKCGGVILDYSDRDVILNCRDKDDATAHTGRPVIRPDGQSIYVDAASCQDKELACARRSGQILYVSPLKYLDTMVKNSYDRLVR